MALRRFRPTQTQDKTLQLIQDSLKETTDSLLSNVLSDNNLVRQVTLVTGNNLIAHGLGRNFVTYFLGPLSSAANVTRGNSPDPSKYISLVSSAGTTVDVLVL